MADFQMENYINEDTIIEDDIYSNFKDSVICGICSNILITNNVHELSKCLLPKMY